MPGGGIHSTTKAFFFLFVFILPPTLMTDSLSFWKNYANNARRTGAPLPFTLVSRIFVLFYRKSKILPTQDMPLFELLFLSERIRYGQASRIFLALFARLILNIYCGMKTMTIRIDQLILPLRKSMRPSCDQKSNGEKKNMLS